MAWSCSHGVVRYQQDSIIAWYSTSLLRDLFDQAHYWIGLPMGTMHSEILVLNSSQALWRYNICFDENLLYGFDLIQSRRKKEHTELESIGSDSEDTLWQGYWMVKRAVGTKACLLGRAVTCHYLRENNFLEVCKAKCLNFERCKDPQYTLVWQHIYLSS